MEASPEMARRLAAIREGLEALVITTLKLEDAFEKHIVYNPEKHPRQEWF